MPHCVLEHSANIKPAISTGQLLSRINKLLNSVAGISLQNCKNRSYIATDYFIGDGSSSNAFVHLDVRFIAGRSIDLKQALGRELKSLLMQHFACAIRDNEVQITVEVRDILVQDYHKHPSGTLTTQPQ